MQKLKLTYFDIDGGRGETARLALFVGGIEFEDHRVPMAEWASIKTQTPFGAMPVLEVDGKMIAQSNAINRFVGKLSELYPTDALQAAFCDEVMDAVEDVGIKIAATFGIKDPNELKTLRQALVDGPIRFFLERIQERLRVRGSQYFSDDRLTVADLKVFVWIRNLKSGKLDHVPTDLPDRVAPLLVEHFERLRNHPKIQEYYRKRGAV